MPAQPLSIGQAASQFSARGTYLDSPAIGLPPRSVSEALYASIDRWRAGELRAPEFDPFVSASRAAFARLLGVPVSGVAVDSSVSSLVGVVAASLPAGAEVVCAEEDFTSVLFPFLVRQKAGELKVKICPLEKLVDAIDERTCLVAVSAVQSADGRLFDAQGLLQACRHFGARTLIDATQAIGWLPLEGSELDYVVAGAYKWLLSPRGTAFMSVRPELIPSLRPLSAGWYAGEEIWASIYGPPLRLAACARQFDVSPAWFSWVGCAKALELIEAVGVAAIHAHDVELSTAFLDRLGRPASGSAIISIPGQRIFEALQAAGIASSRRDGATRIGFHLYNTLEQAIAAADVVRATGEWASSGRSHAAAVTAPVPLGSCEVFLEQAWLEHGERPQQVAEQLRTSLALVRGGGELARYAELVVHVWGEHLGQWQGGLDLLALLRGLPCWVAGSDADAALARAVAALELAGTGNRASLEALAPSERVRVLGVAASALAARAELARASTHFHEALAACQELPSADRAHRALAVASNNLAASLEEKPVRTPEEVEVMLLAARTARVEWELAGSWLNVKRAEDRLVRSCLAAGLPELALQHANACLALCQANAAPALELLGAREALALVEHARTNRPGFDAAIAEVRRCVARVGEADREPAQQRLKALLALH